MPRRRTVEQGDPRVAVAYIRVSTEDQANGLEAQQAAISSWASREGVRVAAWAVDRGVSGGTEPADRDGLMEALAALGGHRAGVLVALDRTRLARDVAVAAAIEKLVQAAGARVVTADGIACDDTPEGALFRTLLDAFAAYQRAVIRANTRRGLAAKRKRGEKLGGEAPFGWRVGDGAGVKRLVPDSLEQAALAFMRKLRGDGKTFAEIAAELDKGGSWPCRGKRWHASSVLRALRGAERQAA